MLPDRVEKQVDGFIVQVQLLKETLNIRNRQKMTGRVYTAELTYDALNDVAKVVFDTLEELFIEISHPSDLRTKLNVQSNGYLTLSFMIKQKLRSVVLPTTPLQVSQDQILRENCYLKQKVSRLEQEVSHLEQEVSYLEEKVSCLEQEVSYLEEEVTLLQDQTEYFRGQVMDIRHILSKYNLLSGEPMQKEIRNDSWLSSRQQFYDHDSKKIRNKPQLLSQSQLYNQKSKLEYKKQNLIPKEPNPPNQMNRKKILQPLHSEFGRKFEFDVYPSTANNFDISGIQKNIFKLRDNSQRTVISETGIPQQGKAYFQVYIIRLGDGRLSVGIHINATSSVYYSSKCKSIIANGQEISRVKGIDPMGNNCTVTVVIDFPNRLLSWHFYNRFQAAVKLNQNLLSIDPRVMVILQRKGDMFQFL